MNTFGHTFRLTTYGESHGAAIGGVVDGMPAGIAIDTDFLQAQLNRRRPGQSRITTSRNESDTIEILSGVFEGRSTGCPIAFIVRNSNQHSSDYDNLRNVFRPSHADYTYHAKYGIRDHRGGGRSSARETISRVAGGALAQLLLKHYGITITAWTRQIGNIVLDTPYQQLDLSLTDQNPVRCPHPTVAQEMENLILSVKNEGDTIGGVVECVIQGCPAGLGSPVFGKLQAQLAAAMLSINAAKGFEYGEGFAGATGRGSEQNDTLLPPTAGHDTPTFKSNHSGGIQGGISNGQDINFRVAFKPVATLLRPQSTIDTDGHATTITAKGRHDPCVLPRAVPIVEAMTAIVIADAILQDRATRI